LTSRSIDSEEYFECLRSKLYTFESQISEEEFFEWLLKVEIQKRNSFIDFQKSRSWREFFQLTSENQHSEDKFFYWLLEVEIRKRILNVWDLGYTLSEVEFCKRNILSDFRKSRSRRGIFPLTSECWDPEDEFLNWIPKVKIRKRNFSIDFHKSRSGREIFWVTSGSRDLEEEFFHWILEVEIQKKIFSIDFQKLRTKRGIFPVEKIELIFCFQVLSYREEIGGLVISSLRRPTWSCCFLWVEERLFTPFHGFLSLQPFWGWSFLLLSQPLHSPEVEMQDPITKNQDLMGGSFNETRDPGGLIHRKSTSSGLIHGIGQFWKSTSGSVRLINFITSLF